MPDLQRKELKGHPAVSRTTIHGWPAVWLSLPFIGAGVLIILACLNVIPAKDSSFHASREAVAAFGGIFALSGLLMLTHGLISLRDKRKADDLIRQYPAEKWRADYPWDPPGVRGDAFQKVQAGLYANLGFTVFCAPFNWLFFVEQPQRVFQFFIGFFDVILAAMWAYWIYLLCAFCKYGLSFLEFHRFPFFLGEKLNATLRTRGPIPGLKKMQVTLRCVGEQAV